MASQALYRKWRSQTFDEIIGQQHVTQTLINALKLNRIAHAYLFAGPRGTGKTSMARLLAKAVNCQAEAGAERPCNRCRICVAVNEGRLLDLIEIDAASNTGVDDIRDLRDKVGFRPGEARVKFYIIDEVHMLSNSAFNALLKTLEEPPEHVIFVLATTEPEKIPATITSRCQRFDFKRIRATDVAERLAYIVAQEGFTAELAALEYIARQGGGSMRDAISLLDQLTAYGSQTITLELVQTVLGTVASQSVVELVGAVINQNVAAGLDIINQVVNDGLDPRQFAREIVEYLRAVMLVKLGDGQRLLNLPEETLTIIKTQAAQADATAIVRATTLFNTALFDLKSSLLAIPQLPLELAFVEAATPVTLPSPVVSETIIAASPPAPRIAVPVRAEPAAPRVISPPPPTQIATGTVGMRSSGSLTMEIVQSYLEQILRELEPKNKTMAEALRNQAWLHRVEGNDIHFITSEWMKARFEKPQPRGAIHEVFGKVLGYGVSVHFLSEKSVSLPAASETSSGGDEERKVDEDSEALIKVAEELGGKVVK
ncbi:MAG: DNA polymerase III subunit gamma/tau [Anaerolineales bacterium]|nr:DNA polymerase III subunit gamma/tau [Anaerolineales bacterium]